MLSGLPEADHAMVWDEVAQAQRQFEGSDGFEAPTELCVGAGIK
jgi:hypothetical protein